MTNSRNSATDDHLFLFRPGKQALEEFEGEQRVRRGIKRRFKHDVEGVLIYDAELLAQLQEGHKHTASCEAIMLLQGEIEACCWDDQGQIETESLSKQGDLVVFPPGQSHTLFVKQDSHVIVVRFLPKDKAQEVGERIAVPLPGELESLREKTLETHYLLTDISHQIDREIKRNKR